ncbi:PKD domain-containing protein [Flavobacterium sp. 3HN19-14]|uniref:Ig-like domain-containing protein n=1 Tax=Flavobacterium sp. 3HN19-14 TaxID=3448133 RepID=UPI003EE06713
MKKTIQFFIIVFVTFIFGNASYAQYNGGAGRGSVYDAISQTSCSIPAHFYAYFGGSEDNATFDLLMNTSCSAPPPSFFAYFGGSNDGAATDQLSATICGTPPSFFAYMGGINDSAAKDQLDAATCGIPPSFYAYFGGSGDGFARDEIGSCPVTPPEADFTASATATCVGGSVDFTDTSTNIPFVWSWTFAGGTPATATTQNPTVVYNTPGTYAVSLIATNYNGGDTETKTSYITVTAVPTVATTTPGSRCDAGSVQLAATASAGVLRWYNVATGGSILGTCFFPTGIISTTTTFYVEAASGSCVSARTAVIATINTTPTVATTTPGARCGTGSVTLGATASAGTLSWFDVATGGTALATGTSFATPSISTNTTYYVQAANGSCISARTAVLATVNTVPTVATTTPGSRCDTGSVTLGATASSGATLNWYNVASGGSVLGTGESFVTPSISANTTYYVEATNGTCTSTRTAVLATASPTPAITSTTPASRCDMGTLTLNATSSAGTLNWYNVPTGGTSLATGTNFLTPSLSATTTYYVDATNGSCVSARTPVIATVTVTPSVTSTTPAGRCGAGSVTLGATASAGTLNWYGIAVGGTVLGTGTGFATGNISVTTTYYVEAVNGSCASPRTPVTATISVMPTILTSTPATRCDTGTLTLSATASAGTLNWFDVATGGTSLGSGNNFVTPSISTTTTYYVQSTSGSCVSPRTAVTATVNLTPTITGTTPASRCDAGSVTLSATASSGTLNWYNVSSGGTSLGSGNTFITGTIATTTTYYVESSNGSCVSSRVAGHRNCEYHTYNYCHHTGNAL